MIELDIVIISWFRTFNYENYCVESKANMVSCCILLKYSGGESTDIWKQSLHKTTFKSYNESYFVNCSQYLDSEQNRVYAQRLLLLQYTIRWIKRIEQRREKFWISNTIRQRNTEKNWKMRWTSFIWWYGPDILTIQVEALWVFEAVEDSVLFHIWHSNFLVSYHSLVSPAAHWRAHCSLYFLRPLNACQMVIL